MRSFYLPDTPLACLGRALFCLNMARTQKFLIDYEVRPFSRRWIEFMNPYIKIISLWPVGYLLTLDEAAAISPIPLVGIVETVPTPAFFDPKLGEPRE